MAQPTGAQVQLKCMDEFLPQPRWHGTRIDSQLCDIEFLHWWRDLRMQPDSCWIQGIVKQEVAVMATCLPQVCRSRRMRIASADVMEHIWGHNLRYNPDLPNHCLYQCLVFDEHGASSKQEQKRNVKRLRALAARALAKRPAELERIASLEGMTSNEYLKGLRWQMWGGQPECQALAAALNKCIMIWSADGRLLVREGRGSPVHIGRALDHFVLLHQGKVSQDGQLSQESSKGGVLRGGMQGGAGADETATEGMQLARWRPQRRCVHVEVLNAYSPQARHFYIDVRREASVSWLELELMRRLELQSGRIAIMDTELRLQDPDALVAVDEVRARIMGERGERPDVPPPPWRRPRYDLPPADEMVQRGNISWHGNRFHLTMGMQNMRQVACLVLTSDGRLAPILIQAENSPEGRRDTEEWLCDVLMCPPERLSILTLPPQQAQLYGVQVLHLVVPHLAVRLLRGGMERQRSRSRDRPYEIGPNGRELMHFVVEVLRPTPYQPRFVFHTAERGTLVRDLRPVVARAMEREERYVELGYPGDELWLYPGEALEQERLEALCEDPMEWGIDMHEEEWPLIDLAMLGREDTQALLFAVIQIPLDATAQRRRYRIPDTTQGHQRMINYIQAQFQCEDWRLIWTLLDPIAAGRYGFDDVTVVIELPRPFGRRAGMKQPDVKIVSTTASYHASEANNEGNSDLPVGSSAQIGCCKPRMVEGGIRSKAGPRKILGLDKSICLSECVSLDFADRVHDDNDDWLSFPNAQPTVLGRKLILCSGRSVVLWARENTSVHQVLGWVCECVPILSGEFDVSWNPPGKRIAQWGFVGEVRGRGVNLRAGMHRRRGIRDRLDQLEDDLRDARFAIQRVQRGVFRLRDVIEGHEGFGDSDDENPRHDRDDRVNRRSRSHSRGSRASRDHRREDRHPEVEEIQSDQEGDGARQEDEPQDDARSQDSSLSRRCNSPIRVAAGPRARVIWPFYNLADRVCVARLHFEYARLSRRGANTFCLVQDGRELLGWNRLGNLVPHVHVHAPAWHETAISYESPLSSMDERPPDFQIRMIRAGSPSKLRGALAKKLAAAPGAPPDTLGLVQRLWSLEPSEIQSVQGSPEQVLKKSPPWSVGTS